MEAKKMQNLDAPLTPTVAMLGDPENHEEQVDALLDGVDELFSYNGKRPIQCFTIKMPFPLYLAYKKRIREIQKTVKKEDKEKFTMTSGVNAAVAKIILPALDKALVRAREEAMVNEVP